MEVLALGGSFAHAEAMPLSSWRFARSVAHEYFS